MAKDSTVQVKAAEKEVLDEKDEVFSNVSSMKDFSQSDGDIEDDDQNLMECECDICSQK